jgi:hypothetical protein
MALRHHQENMNVCVKLLENGKPQLLHATFEYCLYCVPFEKLLLVKCYSKKVFQYNCERITIYLFSLNFKH